MPLHYFGLLCLTRLMALIAWVVSDATSLGQRQTVLCSMHM
jgi:uncharacterized membrane protein YqjE